MRPQSWRIAAVSAPSSPISAGRCGRRSYPRRRWNSCQQIRRPVGSVVFEAVTEDGVRRVLPEGREQAVANGVQDGFRLPRGRSDRARTQRRRSAARFTVIPVRLETKNSTCFGVVVLGDCDAVTIWKAEEGVPACDIFRFGLSDPGTRNTAATDSPVSSKGIATESAPGGCVKQSRRAARLLLG